MRRPQSAPLKRSPLSAGRVVERRGHGQASTKGALGVERRLRSSFPKGMIIKAFCRSLKRLIHELAPRARERGSVSTETEALVSLVTLRGVNQQKCQGGDREA